MLALVGATDKDHIPSPATSIPLLTAQEALYETTHGSEGDPLTTDGQSSSSDEQLRQIIRRNAFGPDFVTYERIQQQNPPFRPFHLLGLYPMAAMINHSCMSNAVRVYAGETMVVHASQAITKGSEVLWSYVPPIEPRRQQILQRQHGFTCH